MDYKKVNDQLEQLYQKKWPLLSEKLDQYNAEKELKASYPLLLTLGEHFNNVDFDNRGNKKIIMCFGQETNGNGGGAFSSGTELKGYEELINQSNLNERHKRMHLWCGVIVHKWIKEHSQELLGVDKDDVFVIWNNIRKISTDNNCTIRGKIDIELRGITKGCFDVIPCELEIIKPDLLFFCTGPSNDDDIERFVGMMENKNEEYKFATQKSEGKLCMFSVKGIKAVRGYYPRLNSTYWKNQQQEIINKKLFL